MNPRVRTSTLGPTWALLSSLLAIFVGERIFASGSLRDALVYGGTGLFVLAVALRAKAWSEATGDVRAVESRLLAAYGGVGVALALYALSTEAGLELLGWKDVAATRGGAALTALWMATMLVSLFAVLFAQLVYARMPIAQSVELRRVTTALQAGVSLALAAVFLLSINYVASVRDVRKDVSYFRTTEPSDGTRSMIGKLDQKLKVVLFFESGSDVLAQLRPYFEGLRSASKHFVYEVKDVALAPQLSTKFKVRSNGHVLLVRGSGDDQKGEFFRVGTELTEARAMLRKLDGTFQQSFTKLVRPERILQLTVGHGERNAKSSEVKPEDGTKIMLDVLKRLNLRTQDLGVSQGLGSKIPETAGAVMVIAPSIQLLPEEVSTLQKYVLGGGKLLLMLDPGQKTGLEPLLATLGLEQLPGTVNSDVHNMARAHNNSDRQIVFSNNYTSHPSVTTVTRNQREVATVLVGATAFKQLPPATGGGAKPKVTFPLRSAREFWLDLDGDFERKRDDEKYEALNLMAAVSIPVAGGKEGRAIVIGDGDFMTDKVAGNHGNYLLFVDMLAWLVGNEELGGEVSSEEDVAIEHTREENKVWFYATTFAVPAPIVGLGYWVARRRRRRAEGKAS
jgi:hypothetical protein